MVIQLMNVCHKIITTSFQKKATNVWGTQSVQCNMFFHAKNKWHACIDTQ